MKRAATVVIAAFLALPLLILFSIGFVASALFDGLEDWHSDNQCTPN